jgi:hypothetical protein
MLCHWTGIYFNGEEVGFRVFQEAVRRMHERFDYLQWMKLSEIARYWAAKELTATRWADGTAHFQAPFACPLFTVRLPAAGTGAPRLRFGGKQTELAEVRAAGQLDADTWCRDGSHAIACFSLPRGPSRLELASR